MAANLVAVSLGATGVPCPHRLGMPVCSRQHFPPDRHLDPPMPPPSCAPTNPRQQPVASLRAAAGERAAAAHGAPAAAAGAGGQRQGAAAPAQGGSQPVHAAGGGNWWGQPWAEVNAWRLVRVACTSGSVESEQRCVGVAQHATCARHLSYPYNICTVLQLSYPYSTEYGGCVPDCQRALCTPCLQVAEKRDVAAVSGPPPYDWGPYNPIGDSAAVTSAVAAATAVPSGVPPSLLSRSRSMQALLSPRWARGRGQPVPHNRQEAEGIRWYAVLMSRCVGHCLLYPAQERCCML